MKVLNRGAIYTFKAEGCGPPAEWGLVGKTGINASNQYNPNRKSIRLHASSPFTTADKRFLLRTELVCFCRIKLPWLRDRFMFKNSQNTIGVTKQCWFWICVVLYILCYSSPVSVNNLACFFFLSILSFRTCFERAPYVIYSASEWLCLRSALCEGFAVFVQASAREPQKPPECAVFPRPSGIKPSVRERACFFRNKREFLNTSCIQFDSLQNVYFRLQITDKLQPSKHNPWSLCENRN